MIITGAALCAHNIVIIPTLCQMRRFYTSSVRASSPESFWHTHNSFFLRIILYDIDRPGFFISCPCFPVKGHDIFFSVIVMEHRGVKPGGMKINRLTPGTFGVLCGNKIIIHIKISCIHGIHNTVYHIKKLICLTVGQARRPDTLCAWKLSEIRLPVILKRMGIKFPAFHISGMVNGNSRKPFKRRYCNIKIISFSADARICMKSRKNRILNHFLPPVYLSAGSSLMKITDNAVKFFIQIIETQNHKAGNKYNNGNPHKTESDRKQCGR